MAFTFFFRDREVLDLIIRDILPDLRTRMYINIWDAGCAMGPEPYSLAMLLRENMGQFYFRNVRIFASDIDENQHFGQTIEQGIYAEQDVKRLPADILARYFTSFLDEGGLNNYQISPEIRQAVRYQKHDLLTLHPIRQGFGLILCKNVLLHFTASQRIDVIRMFHGALQDGGYFVTEHTQKMPAECAGLFQQITPDGQLFQKLPAIPILADEAEHSMVA